MGKMEHQGPSNFISAKDSKTKIKPDSKENK